MDIFRQICNEAGARGLVVTQHVLKSRADSATSDKGPSPKSHVLCVSSVLNIQDTTNLLTAVSGSHRGCIFTVGNAPTNKTIV